MKAYAAELLFWRLFCYAAGAREQAGHCGGTDGSAGVYFCCGLAQTSVIATALTEDRTMSLIKSANLLRFHIARADRAPRTEAHRQMALRAIRDAIALERLGSPTLAVARLERARYHAQFVFAV